MSITIIKDKQFALTHEEMDRNFVQAVITPTLLNSLSDYLKFPLIMNDLLDLYFSDATVYDSQGTFSYVTNENGYCIVPFIYDGVISSTDFTDLNYFSIFKGDLKNACVPVHISFVPDPSDPEFQHASSEFLTMGEKCFLVFENYSFPDVPFSLTFSSPAQ